MRNTVFTLGLIATLVAPQSMDAWGSISSLASNRSIKKVSKKVSRSFFTSKTFHFLAGSVVGLAVGGLTAYGIMKYKDSLLNKSNSSSDEAQTLLQKNNYSSLDNLDSDSGVIVLEVPDQRSSDEDFSGDSMMPLDGSIVGQSEQNDVHKDGVITNSQEQQPPIESVINPALNKQPVNADSSGSAKSVVPFTIIEPLWKVAYYQKLVRDQTKNFKLLYQNYGESYRVDGTILKNIFRSYRKQLGIETDRPEKYRFAINKTNPDFLSAYVALRMMIPSENIFDFMQQKLALDVSEDQMAGFRTVMGNSEELTPIWETLFGVKHSDGIEPTPAEKTNIPHTVEQLRNGHQASTSVLRHPNGTPIVSKKTNGKPRNFADSLRVEGGSHSPSKKYKYVESPQLEQVEDPNNQDNNNKVRVVRYQRKNNK